MALDSDPTVASQMQEVDKKRVNVTVASSTPSAVAPKKKVVVVKRNMDVKGQEVEEKRANAAVASSAPSEVTPKKKVIVIKRTTDAKEQPSKSKAESGLPSKSKIESTSHKSSGLSWLAQRFAPAVMQDLASNMFDEKHERDYDDDFQDNQSTSGHSDHSIHDGDDNDHDQPDGLDPNSHNHGDHNNDEEHHDQQNEKSIANAWSQVSHQTGKTPFRAPPPKQQPNNSSTSKSKDLKGGPVVTVTKAPSEDSDPPTTPGNSPPSNGLTSFFSFNFDFVNFLVKTVNVLFPLFFVALGMLHIIRNGQAADGSFGNTVSAINSAAITMWGIMFAAIAGQSLKAYATYTAERGISLMSLEQLLHSQSFSSAIKQPLLLRRIDVTSICLFLLWALSPIANQALQKMSIPINSNSTQPWKVQTLAFGPDTEITELAPYNGIPLEGSNIPSFSPLFGALLSTSPIGAVPLVDIWGNPKIPLIASFNASTNMDDDWKSISDFDSSLPRFASLTGLPITNYPATGVVDFVVNADYFLFDCSKPIISTPANFDPSFAGTYTVGNRTFGSIPTYSSASQTLWLSVIGTSAPAHSEGIMNWISLPSGRMPQAASDPTPVQIDNSTEFVHSVCAFKNIHTANHITCNNLDFTSSTPCTVDKVRLLKDGWKANPVRDDTIYEFLQLNTGTYVSMAEAYMRDPSQILLIMSGGLEATNQDDFLSMSAANFSYRLQEMFNTYYHLTYGAASLGVYLERNFTYSDTNNGSLVTHQPSGSLTQESMVWQVQSAWLSVYFFSVTVLLIFALADIFWEYRTVSPEFLNFASSVVRSNQQLHKELRGLRGAEKTKAMADMKVMLQDVDATGSTGRIALAPYNSGSSRLNKSRSYR